MGRRTYAVRNIVGLGRRLSRQLVHQHDFIADASRRQRPRHMGAHVARAQDHNLCFQALTSVFPDGVSIQKTPSRNSCLLGQG